VVSSLLMFAAFAPSFYLRSFFRPQDYMSVGNQLSRDGLRPILWAHGLVITLWLTLFVAQTLLVATRRTPTHRRLGVFGGVIAAAMVVVGVATATESARQMTLTNESAARVASGFATNVTAFAVFGMFVVGGLWHRRRPELHKRYMALAMVALLPPGLIRLLALLGIPPVAFLAVGLLTASSVAIFDRLSERRVYSVSLWGAGWVFFLPPLLGAIAGALPAWRTFTAWLVQ
jgi:hypothetical protein